MRGFSQKTVIGVVRDHVDIWRKRAGLSLQAAAIEIVETYYRHGYDRVWPLDFHRGADAYASAKANSERIWRWMDDQTKDSTLLPANFFQVVLLTLPMDLRLMCLSELAAPLGVAVSVLQAEEVQAAHSSVMATMAKESGEGIAAFALLAERMTLDQLRRTEAELAEGIAANQQALEFVRRRLSGDEVGHVARAG
ncbi:hypothetical protein NH8B_1956 [Pseudogulbenkiania sp. NH8B]|uniref:hypothetical protein n=1 Tax=Pseudogulbenkiania sp. (strain NH8B) TaxID=748280 RepID=UPI00022798BB|nr:hypothetical protein [Pseudogulbenkiania sp. NH8B]BAK76771.1 hypothetical protein NH8B_1956 [Pseudogulbenkiania sp. NH8B]